MKHYLVELIQNPKIDEPAEAAPAIHKHFTRFSRGIFDGPIIKMRRTSNKITVWCSYEYEDLALKLALKSIKSDTVTVKGSVISGVNFSSLCDKLGLEKAWYPTKNTGKTQNFTTKLTSAVTIAKKTLEELIDKGERSLYFLLNITTTDPEIKLTTKAKPPRPSNKGPDKVSPATKVKFCSVKLPNTPENIAWIMDAAFADFKDEIPDKWKSILLENSYNIVDLEFPKKKMSSRNIRLQTVRSGTLNRVLEVDSQTHTNSIEFRA